MIKIYLKRKSFGNKEIFVNSKLKLNSGIYILKGENGVGKSTLLNILYKEDNQYEGEIYIDNKNIKDYNISDYRNNICTFITQGNNLFESLTIKENLNILTKNYKEERLNELLDVLNFGEIYKKNIQYKKLSGGEKQKLKIIIGLLSDNSILLIDEIENNLDLESIKNINNYLVNQNKLIIMSSHNLSFENKVPQIIIKNNQIRLNIRNDVYVNQVNIVNKHNNKDLDRIKQKTVMKVSRYPKFIFLIIFIFFMILSSLITLNIKTLFEYDQVVDTGKYGDTSSLIYAPIFNDKFDAIGDASWLKKTPAYFTNEDLQKLNMIDYITNIIPIGDNNKIMGYDYRDDGKVMGPNANYDDLDYEKYGLEDYTFNGFESKVKLQATYLLDSNKVNNNVPNVRTSNVHIQEIVYGSLPEDNSDEIMVDIYYAMYLAKKEKLDSLEELVGTEVNFNLKKAERPSIDYDLLNVEEENISYIISGIYVPYPQDLSSETTFIIYPYDENLKIVQDNNFGIKHPKTYYGDIDYYEAAYSPIEGAYENIGADFISEKEFQKKYPDDLYYTGFYIEVEDKDDLQKLTENILNYNPYIEIKNNYIIGQGNNYSAIKKQVFNKFMLLVGILIVYLIIILLLITYYKLVIIKNIKILQFYGYDQNNIAKYLSCEKISLIKIVAIISIIFYLISMFVSIFLILIYSIIILLTLFLLLIKLRGNKYYGNKSN